MSLEGAEGSASVSTMEVEATSGEEAVVLVVSHFQPEYWSDEKDLSDDEHYFGSCEHHSAQAELSTGVKSLLLITRRCCPVEFQSRNSSLYTKCLDY